MGIIYLSLGTNIGDKQENLRRAVGFLAERVGDVLALSAMYEYEPWGFQSENYFLNCAIMQRTELTPLELLDAICSIEIDMGRREKSKDKNYQDRLIDIDILLYDDWICKTDRLAIPHPLMTERLFVMEPMMEIAPKVSHPILHKTMEELYHQLR